MKQILQSFKDGSTYLEDVPVPLVKKGSLLIKTTHSLVSLGTERMLVKFGKSNLLSKARQQPDKVKQVLDKIKTEGLVPTLEAVFNKLEQPIPLGYCNVGEVVEVGEGVSEFKVGDRVASNGNHAEYVSIPKNLCAKIPDNVSDEEAVFTVIGSIGLQGIRLANPTLGEVFVVYGLGLIGLLTSQLLLANGCKVIGIDIDSNKCEIAEKFGVKTINPTMGNDILNSVLEYTNGIGADGVIITASAKTNEIISQSALISRKRGRIILVGVIGLELNRSEFYEKELTFQVSCSYGPGRYDDNYEQKGIDYPLPFVRWTEKRNFESILEAISTKKIDVNPLITEIIPFEEFEKIYSNLSASGKIASILKYSDNSEPASIIRISENNFKQTRGVAGIIGAGNFTKMTILPNMKKNPLLIKYIASASGITSTTLAKKHNIEFSTSDYKSILADPEVDLVMITTRHNQHAKLVIESLNSGKNVFVEKPLAINKIELEEILSAYKQAGKTLTVGFNRRFSPHIKKIKSIFGDNQMNLIATMNAGFIPKNVWVHDLSLGGGRIIGEACHYIDLITFLTGSMVKEVCMNAMGINPDDSTDNASILLKYENGSTGVINYFANGSKSYSKERIEVYSQEKTLILDNFTSQYGYGIKGFSKMKTKLDKGHKNQFDLLAERIISGGEPLIPFNEIINTTKASFAAIESMKTNCWIAV